MRETGIVVELNGDIAKVSVDRSGAKPDVTEKTLVEVLNVCNAKINDEVIINKTTLKLMRNRSVATFSGTFIAFAIGSGIGNAVLPRLGLDLGAPFSLGIGIVLGCIFLWITRAYWKNRLPALAAYAIEKAAPTT
jgi:hypothetical protein